MKKHPLSWRVFFVCGQSTEFAVEAGGVAVMIGLAGCAIESSGGSKVATTNSTIGSERAELETRLVTASGSRASSERATVVADGTGTGFSHSAAIGAVAGGVAGPVVAAPAYAVIDGQMAAVPAIVMGDPAVSTSCTPS